MDIYEKTLAKTDKTDAILVVDGKKLHVNRALLSYHSEYFNTLFNSEFKEKSMEEIPIEDVKYEYFGMLLSIVQNNPIKPTPACAEEILKLADRFLLPCVKPYLELILSASTIDRMEKIRIADNYQLKDLLEKGISEVNDRNFYSTIFTAKYTNLSEKTKVQLLYHMVTHYLE